MYYIELFCFILWSSFLWRLRGGLLNGLTGQDNFKFLGIPFNDTVVRIIWSIGIALPVWCIHPNIYWLGKNYIISIGGSSLIGLPLFSLSLFAGVTVIGWFGADIVPTKWTEMGMLSVSGITRMIFPAILLMNPIPLIVGSLFGPIYLIGAQIPNTKPWMFWGESLCGAMIGFSFFFL